MESCIIHEQLGMLVDVGLRITTYSQCQLRDASQCTASSGELLDEVCLQVQVVESLCLPQGLGPAWQDSSPHLSGE